MKKKKYEGSKVDKVVDKMTGYKEGSFKDEKMDRMFKKVLKMK